MSNYNTSRSNKAAKISGDTRATLTEDSRTTRATGDLDVRDPDRGEDSVQTIQNQAGTFGRFSINAQGHWSYLLDNGLAATQALRAGATGTDTFVVRSADGSASETVKITVKGTNDPTSIAGSSTGVVKEDAAPGVATGKLNVIDADAGENTVVPITQRAGQYGTFSIQADGTWAYALNNANSTVQKLAEGATLKESFRVFASAGSDSGHDDDDEDHHEGRDDNRGDDSPVSKLVVITIVGSNDAAVISGQTSGVVTEDGVLVANGALTVTDRDQGEAAFQARGNVTGTYGNFSIGVDGQWSYSLNNSATQVQALNSGQTRLDNFTVLSKDGLTSQTVSISVLGQDDGHALPVASHDVYGRVVTFEPGTYTEVLDVAGNVGIPSYDWGYVFTTNDGFQFARDPLSGGPGSGAIVQTLMPSVYDSQLIYTYARGTDDPNDIVMTRPDGQIFGFQSANIFADNNSARGTLFDGGFETVTGFYHGQQVIQQSFYVPEAFYTSINVVDFTNPAWLAVDKVVFKVVIDDTIVSQSNSHQIDNIRTLSNTSQPLDIHVLANDVPGAPGDALSIASFASTSALGAAITLNLDGSLHYDPTVSAGLQALGLRESITDTFAYSVQDQYGGVSNSATVTVQLVGIAGALVV